MPRNLYEGTTFNGNVTYSADCNYRLIIVFLPAAYIGYLLLSSLILMVSAKVRYLPVLLYDVLSSHSKYNNNIIDTY